MKYARLTKEQLEEMHLEFSRFLAAQQINAEEWGNIKKNSPEVAEQELDVFSDLVWEKVLMRVKYVERIEEKALYLFACKEDAIHLIALQADISHVDFRTPEGMVWGLKHYADDTVALYKAVKPYSNDRLLDVFGLINEGGQISNGRYYDFFEKIV